MADLFTLNKSPFEKPTLQSVLRFAPAKSAILFYEDAVYAATAGTPWAGIIQQHADKCWYVLTEDMQARGLQQVPLIDSIQPVDYAGFVDLVVAYAKVQAW